MGAAGVRDVTGEATAGQKGQSCLGKHFRAAQLGRFKL
jgi:hypothetical protein